MIRILLVIPGAPTAKGRAQFAKRGSFMQAYTPKKTVNAEAYLKMLAATEMAGRPPTLGPVRLRVFCYVPIAASWSKKKQEAARTGALWPTRRPDWDNYGKLLSDAFNNLVWGDDSQVVDARVLKRYSDAPRTEVSVEEIGAPRDG